MDNSFLKLYKNDFAQAISNDNLNVSISLFSGFIQMKAKETFLQISNIKEDIAFGGNIKVELIDTCGVVLKDITVDFYYDQFTHTNGVKQIAFEWGMIGLEFFDLLMLKITHTVSDDVWYSNPFLLNDYNLKETTRFDFKNEKLFEGIDYPRANYFQSVRLACFLDDIDNEVTNESYTQLSGNKKTSRYVRTRLKRYKFYSCDNFTYDRLVTLLNHDIIYINGYKVSDKPTVTKGEREVDSNFFEVDFEANLTEEFRPFEYQIYQPLMVVTKVPEGNYTIGDFNAATSSSAVFSLSFNKPFTIDPSITAKIFKDGALFSTIPANKFSIIGQVLNIDASDLPITDNGDYYVIIEPEMIIGFPGFAYNGWKFSINPPDWLDTDWDDLDWLAT